VSAAPSDFERASRSAGAHEVPPPFRAALEAHAALVGFEGSPLEAARVAVVTESTPRSRGFLRRRREHATWVVVSADVLVVLSDASGRPVASIYRLDGLEVKAFESPLVEDEGLDVMAMPVGGSERVSLFVPVAEGPARDALAAALRG
jgi:hypothetical protein